MADKKPKISALKKLNCFFRQDKAANDKVNHLYRNQAAEIHHLIVEETTKSAQRLLVLEQNNNGVKSGDRGDGLSESCDERDMFEDVEEEELKAVQERIASRKSNLAKIRHEAEMCKRSEELKRREMEKVIVETQESAGKMKEKCISLKDEYKTKREEREDLLIWEYSYEALFKAFKIDAKKGVCAEGKPVVCSGPAGFYSTDKLCNLMTCPMLTGNK